MHVADLCGGEKGWALPSWTCDQTSGRDANRVKVKFHYAVEVADLRVQVVCVSQAGRKLVESQLRTGLRPGSNYLDNLGSS